MTVDEFRKELDEYTGFGSSDDWWGDIDRLRNEYPHTIRKLDHPELRSFNCFMHALGLHDTPGGPSKTAPDDKKLVDGCFVRFLLTRGVLKDKGDPTKREPGDLLIYEKEGYAVHAGLATRDKRVVSKWGSGLLLEHEILEVPYSYGRMVRCYEPPNIDVIERLFLQYSRFMRENQDA